MGHQYQFAYFAIYILCRVYDLFFSKFICFSSGSPSGHAMVTSAVLCLFVLWLLNSLRENVPYQADFWRRLIINVTVWSVPLTILSFVSMSRVFIATHFPHQVILGTLIRLMIAFFCEKIQFSTHESFSVCDLLCTLLFCNHCYNLAVLFHSLVTCV